MTIYCGENWGESVGGSIEVNGQQVGTIGPLKPSKPFNEQDEPYSSEVDIEVHREGEHCSTQRRRLVLKDPLKWRSIHEFQFQHFYDKGPCVEAYCLSDGNRYQCHLAPQEAIILPLFPPPYRLQQLPPYNEPALCGTVFEITADHAFCRCAKDNAEGIIAVEVVPLSLSAVWDYAAAGSIIVNARPPQDWIGLASPGLVMVELSLPLQSYEQGTPLLVVAACAAARREILTDAKVQSLAGSTRPIRYCLQAASGPFTRDLSVFNHCRQRFVSVEAFFQMVHSYCQGILEAYEYLKDTITGMKLRTADQTVKIGFRNKGRVHHAGWTDAKDMLVLARRIYSAGTNLPVIVVAAAGTGKTWGCVQLVYELARLSMECQDGVPLVPVLVSVQRLVHVLAKHERQKTNKNKGKGEPQRITVNVLLQYFQEVLPRAHPEYSHWLLALEQLLEMRALVIVLDGIDEAAGQKKQIARFLREELVQKGFRVVASSRPEGVTLADYDAQFVALDLEPLSEEQQRVAVEHQLLSLTDQIKGFAQHLVCFSVIRRKHDETWTRAFESSDAREAVEALNAPDRLLDENGEGFDPEMRQRCLDGTRIVQRRPGRPNSTYLRHMDAELSPALQNLDPEMQGLDVHLRQHCPQRHKVASDLILLFKKLDSPGKWTLLSLWQEVMACTDEIYEVAERLEPEFRKVLEALVQEAGLPITSESLQFGPLKNPVRIYEKAQDDYQGRFTEGLTEACVADVVRARVVCHDGQAMCNVLLLLARQFSTGQSHLELVRVKNKCASKNLDPTHFRNVLVNCQLKSGRACLFVEVQVHHLAVLQHNEQSHAHTHYDYFRSKFRNKYQVAVDEMLERMLLFFEEIKGVPVLLSMLVLILRHLDTDQELPVSRSELYKQATTYALVDALKGTSIGPQDVMSMLQLLALKNHRVQRRVFSSRDVHQMLGGRCLALWEQFQANDGDMPLVKILQLGTTVDDDLFEFRHLSLQEALFVQSLCAVATVEDGGALSDGQWLGWMGDPFYDNAFCIGGTDLGRALSKCCQPELALKKVRPQALNVLCKALQLSMTVKTLNLEGMLFDAPGGL